MSPADGRIVQLVAEIERDWLQVKEQLARSQSVDATVGEAQAALVALSLDHAYQAFETILLRIERALGLPERQGSHWHSRALDDASAPLVGLRPPVFPPAARGDWEALLRFRHFLRHAYAVPLDPEELAKNRTRLERAVARSADFVTSLVDVLRRMP